MRIVVDQQLPPVLADWLHDQGLAAFHVRDLGLKDSPDQDICAEASRDGSVVISRDEDFVRLLRERGKGRLIWLRVGNCSNASLLSILETRWAFISERLRLGDPLIEIRA